MMNKRIRIPGLVLLLGLLGVYMSAGPQALAGDEIVLKFSTVAPEGTPWTDQLVDIKNRVNAGSDVKFKLFPGSMLGGEVETLKKARRNQVQGWGGSTAAIAEALNLPALQVFELPFLFDSEAEADFVMDSMFDLMHAKVREKGFELSFWHVNGWHNFAARKAIKSPEDLKGLKMRSQESDLHLATFNALGAQPQTIPVPEVLSSLQTGIVTSFSNTPLFTAATGWYEGGITHYTISHHIYQPAAILYNAEFWDSLTAEQQGLILGDRAAETKRGRDTVRALTPILMDDFQNEFGIEIVQLTPAERQAFADLTSGVADDFKDKIGADVLTAALLARDTYRASH